MKVAAAMPSAFYQDRSLLSSEEFRLLKPKKNLLVSGNNNDDRVAAKKLRLKNSKKRRLKRLNALILKTISFVKYEKNPNPNLIESLKSKYCSLNADLTKNKSIPIQTPIDFVKYEKNDSPMESLKSKYSNLISINNINKETIKGTTLLINKQQQRQQQQQQQKIPEINKSFTNGNLVIESHLRLDLNWSRIKKVGIGLYNLGNNCYLNATLQCLAYTPPLSQWLVAKPHSPSCKFKQLKGGGFCSLCEVERIIFDIFNSPNGFAKPNNLCLNIKKISNVFVKGRQEDASEFFTTLLENMAKSIKASSSSVSGGTKQQQKPTTTETIFDKIFSFQFVSRITCSKCGKLSDTIENTNIWPIDVKFAQDITQSMLRFLKVEVLDGRNAYKCDKCHKMTRATKKYSLRSAPHILVIHLKRFDFSYAGKLSHFVAYPESLSMKNFLSESSPSSSTAADTSMNYKLYGVLVHLGNTSRSGHYYSFVRGPNDQWYKADDTSVHRVNTADVLRQKAYILFYRQTSVH